MVMVFTSVGLFGAAAVPGSFSAMCIVASPRSLKMVGHGAEVVHGAGDVTFVMTSEDSGFPAVPRVAAPRMPASESMIRYEGALPERTTSPHDAAVGMRATAASKRVK